MDVLRATQPASAPAATSVPGPLTKLQIHTIATEAANQTAKNARTAPQLCYGPIRMAIEDGLIEIFGAAVGAPCRNCAGSCWEPGVYAGRRPCSHCQQASSATTEPAWKDAEAARQFAHLDEPAAVGAPQGQAEPYPAVLFDGKAVYDEITAKLGKAHCHSPDSVAATLDAVVRLMKRDGAQGQVEPVAGLSEIDKLRIMTASAIDDLEDIQAELGFPDDQEICIDAILEAIRELAAPAQPTQAQHQACAPRPAHKDEHNQQLSDTVDEFDPRSTTGDARPFQPTQAVERDAARYVLWRDFCLDDIRSVPLAMRTASTTGEFDLAIDNDLAAMTKENGS
jgi:hypothetical protein